MNKPTKLCTPEGKPSASVFTFPKVGRYWSARVSLNYRAVGVEAADGIVWFWIGMHVEYDQLIRSSHLAVRGELSSKACSKISPYRVALLTEARMAQGNQPQWEQSYRERALKLFPWICARCGRDFDGKKLSQLTVHHKDHNHDNNPPDGSNWELLCLYCHDNEHQRYQVADASDAPPLSRQPDRPSTFTPFAHLADLLKHKT